MASIVSFRLNGEVIALEDPPPELLLIDYLRSPEVGLTGAKKGCGQGGCGACTVIVSQLNERSGDIEHRAVNSCLRPVCALGGLAVTTIEGTGAPARLAPAHLAHRPSFSRSAAPHGTVSPAVARAAGRASENRSAALAGDRSDGREPINEVAYRLAMNNGTQCGYCSAGFVMNMSALLAANPAPTKREIEDVFDGNLCRCTGFRSILTGMKTFAADWSEHDEVNRMKLRGTDTVKGQFRATPMSFEFPADEPPRPAPVNASRAGRRWVTPETIDEACAAMRDAGDLRLRLVAANTSFGIYPREFLEAQLLVDIGKITELHGVAEEPPGLRAGAGATYTELLEVLAARDDGHGSARGAAELMARRTAGTIVRNAATLGGNTMLVLAHIAAGEPFPSDLLTALAAIGADIEFARASTGERARLGVGELIAQAAADPAMHRDLLLLAYHLPAGDENDVVLAQKVALREVNAHSLVNATTRLRVGEHLAIEAPVLVYGGIAPYPWRPEKTEAELAGRALSLDGFPALAEVLRAEVGEQLELSRDRMAGLPSEGITDAYRTELAVAFLYKALVNALLQRTPDDVPPAVRSSGEIRWGRWPVSDGTQDCKIQRWKAPVSQPYVKLMALYQTTGSLHYTHEIELPPSAVNAAFVHSRRALADSALTVPGRPGPATRDDLTAYLSQRFDAFIALLTHEDVPEHGVNLQGMGSDQPLLTDRRVSYVGQAIALVIAEGEQDAIEIAEYASEHCVDYRPVDWTAPWNEPVLSLDRAIEIGSVFPDFPKTASWAAHVWKITRPGSRFEWTTPDKNALDETIAVRTADVDGVECTVVESTQRCGGQAHFYMETQACVAVPLDGGRLLVQPSTQSPAEMHQTVAMTLGVEHNRVEVRVNPVGGGFGGKTEQTRFVAGPAALAAHVLERPVRLVLKREHDTALIGKRHAFYGQYQIAIDRRDGRIRGFQCRMWGDGGAFYDCSYIVSNCIQLRADNAYRVPNFENQIDVCRTNTAPSTAFRAFGDIQGKLLTENAIDDAAFAAGVSAEDVRFANFYERGDVTPFGQALSYCYMKEVWEYLIGVCDFERQKAEVEGFNRANRWRKRGIAMVPVKYGSGYNLVQLEQAMAYVVVHAGDGSVTIHQGGVEMGQGALTIIEQVASYVLNVPMDLLHVEGPNTSIIPNPASTGASTGTAYNATAVKRACEELRARLTEFGHRMLDENGQDWCAEQGIDFWTRGEQGWAAQAETPEPPKLVWQNLVSLAYQQRVSLNVAFVAPIRGGETPVPALTFKPLDTQRPIPGIDVDQNPPPPGPVDSFTGFTYSAACSVVEVDVLTGEVKVLSSDIVYDTGWSLNPAIDIGQVEGAFVQGLGYVLTERLVFQPDREERGTLTTDNTWRYKLPATATIPLKLNTYLFPRDRVAVPEDGNELFSSKEVGEPPLVLATSVFFAIKAAVRASRLERGLDGLFRLDAPATVQEVRRACDVATGELE